MFIDVHKTPVTQESWGFSTVIDVIPTGVLALAYLELPKQSYALRTFNFGCGNVDLKCSKNVEMSSLLNVAGTLF